MKNCFPLWVICVFSLALLVTGCKKGDDRAQSELDRAIASGDAQAIARMNIGLDRFNIVDEGGWTPLAKAVKAGHADVVEAMLQKGADSNTPIPDGTTPLMLVPQAGSESASITTILMNNKADPNMMDNRGMTAYLIAVTSGREDLAQLMAKAHPIIIKKGKGRTALGQAVETGAGASTIATLLKGGADPNEPDADKMRRTPLTYAASAGNITAIKALIAAGAKTEARDAVGKTAIFYAAGLDQSKAITALVDAGAVVDAVENTGGGTALMTCISGVGRIDSIKALLRAGADPDKKDRAGISALEAARSRRLSDKIMLLESASTVHSNRPE